MAAPVQNTDIPQVNDSTGVQDQNTEKLPSTVPSTDLQSNANNVNDLRSSKLQVKTGPTTNGSGKKASGTVISIILVTVILIVAAGLFIASLRVPQTAKPSVAPGAEEAGALGKKTKKFKRNKKVKK